MTAPTPSPSSPLDLKARAYAMSKEFFEWAGPGPQPTIVELMLKFHASECAISSQGADPGPPAAGLEWTKDKPTVPGWYWSRWKNGCYDVLYLGWYSTGDHGERELAIDVGHGYDRIEMKEGDAWFGPLLPPPLPEGEVS